MIQQPYGKSFGGNSAENYQRFFVPSIGAPLADDLIHVANLRPGERVVDVACGTGVVTRLAAERVGGSGAVAGVDINPAMLAVGRSATPPGVPVDWYEASAESMPLADRAFDVVLCQMGLQFFPDKPAALGEMRRVLDSDGRVLLTLPGPKPPLFATIADALAHHLGPQAAGFVDVVFSMHDASQIAELIRSTGFRDVDVQTALRPLRLPEPADFLWQYIHSTPLAEAAARMGDAEREALEREICREWQAFAAGGGLALEVGMTTATARK